ncbi:hypothetical protein FALBO_12046 [Fusarium albosuccineum]|uniref:Uncharacterized protein n=1 Tax=Fusarium albosuccineum TaxID=1237068 RepID=A0A8H4L1F3_9HYPO|nr:hypothetical protein FALBO_12046 [Fusarium albosuccineum]
MKFTLSLILFAALVSRATADFDVYMELKTEFWLVSQFAIWQEPPTDCVRQIWPAPSWPWLNDVSGNKKGVRCKGDGCDFNGDAHNIEQLEMHFSNNPLYHWTLYNVRGADGGNMVGLDGKVYGACYVDQDDPLADYVCYTPSGGDNIWRGGNRKFRCESRFTAKDILDTK